MHAGFSMLETGSVRHKNAVNILFKNIATISIAGIVFWLIGYGFAYGKGNFGSKCYSFIGTGEFALSYIKAGSESMFHFWFFQFAFAATGTTIVSGAVAGRINLNAYFMIAVIMIGFTYPVIVHWIWAADAWLAATHTDLVTYPSLFQSAGGCGVIDFAGSGVVHLTGGVAAFWASLFLGPRHGRFNSGDEIAPHNVTMQALGVLILWFGWYGFNCASTLSLDGVVASRVAVVTTLSPCAAVITSIFLSHFSWGHFDIGFTLNSALSGLVSITAACSVVPAWSAPIVGFVSCFLYLACSKAMIKLEIDDPVDAVAVHGGCGIWGLLCVGIFASKDLSNAVYPSCEFKGNTSGIQFASQLIAVLSIIAWVSGVMIPFLFMFKKLNFLRVPLQFEEMGMDVSEHGGRRAFFTESEERKVTPEIHETIFRASV